MNAILDRILDLPRTQKIAILVAIIVGLLALDYTSLYAPRSERITELTEQVHSLSTEREKKAKLAADLPKLKQLHEQLDGLLKQAITQLPERREIPDLLSNISTKAKESGLEIVIFRPRPENAKDFYAEIPVDITVRGGFHHVAMFFDEVSRLSRLVNLTNIDMKSPKPEGERVVMEVSTLATTFRFLDDAERSKAAAAPKK